MYFSKRIVAGVAAMLLVLAFAVGLSACGGGEEKKESETTHGVKNERETFPPAYVPSNHVEFNNFNKAQKLYDTPSTIIWCTSTWGNPSAPMVTVPVAGKLTSSSVSYLPQDKAEGGGEGGNYVRENFSDDGMYHGHPPAYRYGFTPGGQYVDFSEMPALCTTALTEFQRQQTEVTIAVNQAAKKASEEAEKVLAEGTDPTTKKISPKAEAEAQRILLEANLNGK